jgi:hypothetical protein
VTDPQGNTLTYSYDGRNMTTVRSGPVASQTLSAALDYNGTTAALNCTRITTATGPRGTVRCSRDGNGTETIYRYDVKGNLTATNPPPPLANETFKYDALSRASPPPTAAARGRRFSTTRWTGSPRPATRTARRSASPSTPTET